MWNTFEIKCSWSITWTIYLLACHLKPKKKYLQFFKFGINRVFILLEWLWVGNCLVAPKDVVWSRPWRKSSLLGIYSCWAPVLSLLGLPPSLWLWERTSSSLMTVTQKKTDIFLSHQHSFSWLEQVSYQSALLPFQSRSQKWVNEDMCR